MTREEYIAISKALKECTDGIVKSFDTFNESLRDEVIDD